MTGQKCWKCTTDAVSPYSDDDLESLPAVPNHPLQPLKLDCQTVTQHCILPLPYRVFRTHQLLCRVLHIHQKTKLQFSSSVKSDNNDSDSESYQSAVSEIKMTKRMHKSRGNRKRSSNLIQHFPKGLYFDGKSNWETFEEKFKKCSLALEWTSDECLTGLIWTLTGKRADFYAVISDRDKLSYPQMLKRLENRFGASELLATAQARFQQATQTAGESLED